MRTSIALPLALAACLALAAPTPRLRAANPSNRQTDVARTSAGDLRLMPIYHGSVMLEFDGQVIHVDPWSEADYTGLPPADLLVITHTHADHLDRSMIDRLHKPSTIIVAPPAVADTLNCAPACGSLEIVANGEKKTVMGIGVEGVPMYNLVQGSAPGKPFHHKGAGGGNILGFADRGVYFSADTESGRGMKAWKGIDIGSRRMTRRGFMPRIKPPRCGNA